MLNVLILTARIQLDKLSNLDPEIRSKGAYYLYWLRDLPDGYLTVLRRHVIDVLNQKFRDPMEIEGVKRNISYVFVNLCDTSSILLLVEVLLNNGDPILRNIAGSALAEMGYWGRIENFGDIKDQLPPDTVDSLIFLLEHVETEIRCGSLAVLSGLGDSRAVDPILNSFNQHPSEDYWRIARDWWKTFTPLDALSRFHDDRAFDFLTNVLARTSSERWQRVSAMYSLGRSGNPRSAPHIALILNDSDLGRYAAEALGWLAEKTNLGEYRSLIVEQLIEAIENADHSDFPSNMRFYGSLALGNIGNLTPHTDRAVNALLHVLSDPNAYGGALEALRKLRVSEDTINEALHNVGLLN